MNNRFGYYILFSLVIITAVNVTAFRIANFISMRLYESQMKSLPFDSNMFLMKKVYDALMLVIYPHTKLNSTLFFGINSWYSWVLVVVVESFMIAVLSWLLLHWNSQRK